MTKIVINLVIVLCICFIGCGRMGYPYAPEDLGSEAVKELKITALADGIQFTWEAPSVDVRGEPLKSLDGYRVVRKKITSSADLSEEELPFDTLDMVADNYVVKLKELEEQALAQGRPRRRISVPAEFKSYSFVDREVQAGNRYLYQVLPINQGDVIGQSKFFVDVAFSGINSKITLMENIEDEQL